jgi:hypothetical protein
LFLTGISLEQPKNFVESEFLQRELAINWVCMNEEQLKNIIMNAHKTGRRSLVIVSNPLKYLNLFSNLPNDCICLLLLSDEGYSRNSRKLAIGSKSVVKVIRNYSITSAKVKIILNELIRLCSAINKLNGKYRHLVNAVLRGWLSTYRMLLWRKSKVDISILPLGYTNKFAKEYAKTFKLTSRQSLFKFAVENIPSGHKNGVTFRGTRGQIQRQIDIDLRSIDNQFDLHLLPGPWSGIQEAASNSENYLQSLLSNRYTLAPPGFVNNESFRYYEALLCGSMPIEDAVAITHMGTCPSRPILNNSTVKQKLEKVLSDITDLRKIIYETLNS